MLQGSVALPRLRVPEPHNVVVSRGGQDYKPHPCKLILVSLHLRPAECVKILERGGSALRLASLSTSDYPATLIIVSVMDEEDGLVVNWGVTVPALARRTTPAPPPPPAKRTARPKPYVSTSVKTADPKGDGAASAALPDTTNRKRKRDDPDTPQNSSNSASDSPDARQIAVKPLTQKTMVCSVLLCINVSRLS